MSYLNSFLWVFLLFFFILAPQAVYADTTPYRSAGWVATDTWRTDPYTNLTSCQKTDGNYCSHPFAAGAMNLYFSSFGNLSDFGIPHGSNIQKVHIRVTGKNTVTQWVQLDKGRNTPLQNLCQNPFDLWQVYLGPNGSVKELNTTFDNVNLLATCFTPERIDAQNFTISLFFNGYNAGAWNSDIDNLEIAFDYIPGPTPTPTSTPIPSPTPTPIPTPAPFLDLPWEYEGDFASAALAINSYFDHEYPLLSSGLHEPHEVLNSIVTFRGLPRRTEGEGYYYSTHDGYDYARLANVRIGNPVVAAAAGWATYVNTCRACGNMITIDHTNGYQTRYLHLQKDGLITSDPNTPVWVENRQAIGKVGATGNVSPAGDAGAHIHFGVIEDKDKDSNFENNIPDGATDPFGWQSDDPDPWGNYSFFYNGKQRTGNKSYYLWTKKLPGMQTQVAENGGVYNTGAVTVTLPEDTSRPLLTLDMQYAPYANASASLVGIMPSVSITAKNILGDLVHTFPEPLTITMDYSTVDLSRFDLENTQFSLYSSDDQEHWVKETTSIDRVNKKATAKVNHLTYFTLMAERQDTVAPTTTMILSGEKGQEGWLRSDAGVILQAKDNDEGLGVDYTLYKVDEEDWQTYTTPFVITTEGKHTVSFYSVDNDNNIEDVQTHSFTIDKTPPEATIVYDLNSFLIEVTGNDDSGTTNVVVKDALLRKVYTITDEAGNKLTLNTEGSHIGKQSILSIKELQYNASPKTKLENNLFFTLVLSSNNRIKQIDQYFSLKEDKRMFSKYLSSENSTKIYTKTPGTAGYALETKSGIVLLKLYTQNGTLKYSY